MQYFRRLKSRTHWQLLKTSFVFLLSLGFVLFMVRVTLPEFFPEANKKQRYEPAHIIVNTAVSEGPLKRPWRNLAQGGESHDWRLQPISAQVAALQPEYIRLDHIYDFYDIVGGSSGNLHFDFSKLDLMLDDILATGAKPYLALSYMPPAIATGDIVSPPVSYADWQVVVQRTIEHVSGTRGIANVYYEVWNEPDLFGDWKYYGKRNYLDLYRASARGAKAARGVQPFKIGGPATTALYRNWLQALAKVAQNEQLPLHFISWHRYSHDINVFRSDISTVRSWLVGYPSVLNQLEFHITEWGHDSENHAGYDSQYGAAHTVATSLEMEEYLDKAFVFEIQDGKDPQNQALWGRWGLLTHADFGSTPKPRYHALKFLNSIRGQKLQLLGKGTYVKALAAKHEQGYTVLLANFDPQGVNHERVPVTFTNLPAGIYAVVSSRPGLAPTHSSFTVTANQSIQTSITLPALSYGSITVTPN